MIRRLWIQTSLGEIFNKIYFVLCKLRSVRWSDRKVSDFLIVKNPTTMYCNWPQLNWVKGGGGGNMIQLVVSETCLCVLVHHVHLIKFWKFFPHDKSKNLILREVGLRYVIWNPWRFRLNWASENLEKLIISVWMEEIFGFYLVHFRSIYLVLETPEHLDLDLNSGKLDPILNLIWSLVNFRLTSSKGTSCKNQWVTKVKILDYFIIDIYYDDNSFTLCVVSKTGRKLIFISQLLL